MEQKTFNIINVDGTAKVQIGSDVIVLDLKERLRLINVFKAVKESTEIFPAKLQGACLMYPDGLIAANISLAKMGNTENNYLMFVYHLVPHATEYQVNNFIVPESVLDLYIKNLA